TTDISRLASAAVPKSQTESMMAEADATVLSQPSVVAPTADAVASDPDAAQFILTGNADEQFETVDIYVNSELEITTVETNKKSWSSKLAFSSLDPDVEHTLYTVATRLNGETVRSPLGAFAAKAAPASAATEEGGRDWKTIIAYGALVLALLGLLGYLVVVRRKNKLPV
ncbi:MAG: hypothetical protein AAB499_02030, partial [Patescibacteria group bacterium]